MNTPGTWTVIRNGDDLSITGKGGLLVAEMPANGHPVDAYVEADAYLMAAAKEMLGALEVAVVCYDNDPKPGWWYKQARAAIAKARGGT